MWKPSRSSYGHSSTVEFLLRCHEHDGETRRAARSRRRATFAWRTTSTGWVAWVCWTS